MGAASDGAEDNEPRRFDVELFVVHPTMDPADISARLGLEPTIAHPVDGKRRTPKGTVLTGRYRDTRWRHSIRHETRGQHFAGELAALLDRLSPHKTFLAELRATGGQAMLIVQFLGDDGYFG